MAYQDILYEVADGIATIWHNRPERRNAESRRLLDELDAALREAVENPEVRVVVLAAKGPHFSAGHDLKEAQESRANFTVEQRWEYEELRYYEYCMRILDCPKPTIAAVQGACVAGGFMVVNMCDLIVASEDAFFSDPVAHSMGAAAVEVLIHPWVMGLRKAKEILFTGERLTARAAHEAGMVNRVVATDALHGATMEMARKIAAAPPFTLKILKRSLNRVADIQGLRTSLQAHFDTHQLSHVTEAFKSARDTGLAAAIRAGKAAG